MKLSWFTFSLFFSTLSHFILFKNRNVSSLPYNDSLADTHKAIDMNTENPCMSNMR